MATNKKKQASKFENQDENEVWLKLKKKKDTKHDITKIWKNTKKKMKHQHNTDDGGQPMGEEMRHVQMSRWGKHKGEESEQQYDGYEAEGKAF